MADPETEEHSSAGGICDQACCLGAGVGVAHMDAGDPSADFDPPGRLSISCAVASASLLTSAVKIASKPASSASLATALTSAARHPAPGMIPRPSRSAISASPSFHFGSYYADPAPWGEILPICRTVKWFVPIVTGHSRGVRRQAAITSLSADYGSDQDRGLGWKEATSPEVRSILSTSPACSSSA
jgi:hypothetical protein